MTQGSITLRVAFSPEDTGSLFLGSMSVQSVQEDLSFAGTPAGLNVRDSTYWKVHLTLKRSLGLVQYNQRRTRLPISDFCDP